MLIFVLQSASAAFTPMGMSTMVMGDTVLFEDEVNPAMSAALEAGLEVTALHNHFYFDQPKVYFMHIGGMGDTARLARADGIPVIAHLQSLSDAERELITECSVLIVSERVASELAPHGELEGAGGVYAGLHASWVAQQHPG